MRWKSRDARVRSSRSTPTATAVPVVETGTRHRSWSTASLRDHVGIRDEISAQRLERSGARACVLAGQPSGSIEEVEEDRLRHRGLVVGQDRNLPGAAARSWPAVLVTPERADLDGHWIAESRRGQPITAARGGAVVSARRPGVGRPAVAVCRNHSRRGGPGSPRTQPRPGLQNARSAAKASPARSAGDRSGRGRARRGLAARPSGRYPRGGVHAGGRRRAARPASRSRR
jgi:hypothetical protein